MAFDPKLGQLFLFDADELRANNQGRLTSEQELLLRNAAQITDRQLKRSRVWVPFVLLAALAASAYGLSQTPGTDTKDVILPVAILAWIAAIVLFFARRGRRYQQAYAHPQLRSVEGEVAFSPTSSSTGGWHLKVAGVTFVVESLATGRMTEGARYRVNYLEPGVGKPVPLSVERVSRLAQTFDLSSPNPAAKIRFRHRILTARFSRAAWRVVSMWWSRRHLLRRCHWWIRNITDQELNLLASYRLRNEEIAGPTRL